MRHTYLQVLSDFFEYGAGKVDVLGVVHMDQRCWQRRLLSEYNHICLRDCIIHDTYTAGPDKAQWL